MKFNLGRLLEPQTHAPTESLLLYDPDDLTTHAVVVGMTGSGKTGLCIDLLEEAALSGLPSILIDPKGDITNLLLQFPDLAPADFQKWVNVDEARRAHLPLEDYAAARAAEWRAGLAQWGLGPANIARLKESVEWALYTPGSDAGRPVSVLRSFDPPSLSWDDNTETLRERIAGTVSALLGLVGLEADPVRSREHILLANIFEHAWRAGQPLDLAAIITQVQTPPFAKLGVFDVERFYPEKDRFNLALALNAIAAAPSFQSWVSGEALDVPALLRTPEGKPRCSIFYVAHLSDAERMFFIALLLEQVTAWLRGQTGSAGLRALLYFDEVYGYFPPYPLNPPTKQPLMRLLKQARAFGLGVVLVTQNPGDLDYKGLTNTGSWFIGKLQTDRDKARLLEGLATISAQGSLAFNPSQLDTLISSLKPRNFLLNNVHAPAPLLFETRWAMSYLAGPLTREQIRAFKPPSAAALAAPATGGGVVAAAAPPSAAAPAAPSASVPQYFLPVTQTLEDAVLVWREATGQKRAQFEGGGALVYRPVLFAQALVRYVLARANLNADRRFAYALDATQCEPVPHWAEAEARPVDAKAVSRVAPSGARLADEAPGRLLDPKRLAAWQKDLTGYLYRTADFALHYNPALKAYARPGQSFEEFRAECGRAAAARRDEALAKVRARYDKKLDRLEDRRAAEQREVGRNEDELRARESESRWTGAENILGLVLGHSPRRMMSVSESKKRLAQQARNEVTESKETVETLTEQITQLKAEAQAEFAALAEKWQAVAQDVQPLRLTPKRADILLEVFGLGWRPIWKLTVDGQPLELPAYL
ncbi:MAG: ATP-binding protein [Anaerolineales bacterium]|nr:ATP-binding protein [Anaerolineales bacterium]